MNTNKKHIPRIITWIDGVWHEGNVPAIGLFEDGVWLGHGVFDGARAFDGFAPDLERHSVRLIQSAMAMGMQIEKTAKDVEAICREGIRKYPTGTALYICQYVYLKDHFFDPSRLESRLLIGIYEAPMVEPVGFRACVTPFRRPSPESAPTNAKACGLYPNVRRSVWAAKERGFDTAIMPDPLGNVAEFSFSNLFMVKDKTVLTPAINGSFLNGLTRQRVIALLREDGYTVEERTLSMPDLLGADEVFGTANYSKIMPCVGLEERTLEIGPTYRRARELYLRWSEGQPA